MEAMKCISCQGRLKQTGTLTYECESCGLPHRATANADGTVSLVLVEKIGKIEEHTETTANIATEDRLKKRIASCQEKIDMMHLQWEASTAKKLFWIAIGLMGIGGIVVLSGLGNITQSFGSFFLCLVFGGAIAACGWFLLQYHQSQRAEFESTVARLQNEELQPLRSQLGQVRSQLDSK